MSVPPMVKVSPKKVRADGSPEIVWSSE